MNTKGNKDTDNVELRKRFFDMFMKRIGRVKHLFTCHLTKEFLRSKSVDMEKVKVESNLVLRFNAVSYLRVVTRRVQRHLLKPRSFIQVDLLDQTHEPNFWCFLEKG